MRLVTRSWIEYQQETIMISLSDANQPSLPDGEGVPLFAWEWSSRRLWRRCNSRSTKMQMMTRAPKAPPIMGPIGTSDFPCVAVIALAVAPSEKDRDDAGDDPGEPFGEDVGERGREGCVADDNVDEDKDDGGDCSVEGDDGDESDDGEGGSRVPCTIAKESM